MTSAIASALTPMLRRVDPERAHTVAVLALRLGLAGGRRPSDDAALAVEVLGSRFPNPFGLAAGFDKNAKALRGLGRLGFGFVEAGTVTPRPQQGNPRPRVFRLEEDGAVINRYGLNSEGFAAFATRLARLPRSGIGVPLGINIGPNKDGDAQRDLPALVAALQAWGGAGYVAVNVSSPNTPGLRDLQRKQRLAALLAAIHAAAQRNSTVLVKIAPDQPAGALEEIVETCVAGGVAGLIVGNTTVDRPATLRSPARAEAGGLSGTPLLDPSTRLLRDAFRLAQGRLTLIGCGGVRTGADALAKIKAGASLVQLYTAFAYEGPALLPRLKRELLNALRRDGFERVGDAVGANA
jgi:dihydroorotate dehydrogenase